MGIIFAQNYDYGDLPDPGYPTKLASNGARHTATSYLFLGTVVADQEGDAYATSTALGDDQNGSDDEDGFNPAAVLITPGSAVNLPVKVTNMMSLGSAWLFAFVDWNHDGDFADANETVTVTVPGPSLGVTVNVPVTVPANAITTAPTPLRLRLATDQSLGATGLANNGEVEDYFIQVTSDFDYGDLPAPYPTLLADDGARHIPSEYLYMGLNGPDTETDGHPDAFEEGDDSNSIDDEDGFNPAAVHPVRGAPVDFPVIVTTPSIAGATLYGFTDWNNDGDFDDTGEKSSVAVPANSIGALVNLPWTVPATAAAGVPLVVRLRLTSNLNVGPTGLCTNGEVEDYHVVIASGALDFGDLPDDIAGVFKGAVTNLSTVTQADYRTRLADDGPRHGIRSDLYIGDPNAAVVLDAEANGQPTGNADGDDLNGPDEVGANLSYTVTNQTITNLTPVSLDATWVMQVAAPPANNHTGTMGYATAFMDMNNDGDFDDSGEKQTIIVPSKPGQTPLNFIFSHTWHVMRPITSFTVKLPVRIRLSTEPDLGSNGPAVDGEVEDHLGFQAEYNNNPWSAMPVDFGDLVQVNPWNYDGFGQFPVTVAADGACHSIVPGIYLGDQPPDAEEVGQPTMRACGDDVNGTDDEDGFVPENFHPVAGQPIDMIVKVTTSVTAGATLYGFIDWNFDGDFDEPGERSSIAVNANVSGQEVALPWNVPVDAVLDTMLFARLRLSSDPDLGPGGLASDGEVEDYRVSVLSGGWDFGELPDAVDGSAPGVLWNLGTTSQGDYRTRLADNGARHKIRPDLVFQEGLNIPIDAEPDAILLGDDTSGPSPEVAIYAAIMKQVADPPTAESIDIHLDILLSTSVVNETGQVAYLHAFMDANNDGDFDDEGERATVVVPSVASLSVPDFLGEAYSPVFHPTWHILRPITGFTVTAPIRLRLSTLPELGPDGPAPDGEVQDMLLSFSLSMDAWWPDPNAGFDAFMWNRSLLGASSLPDADPDHDGQSNFKEYAFGGNPGQPDAMLAFRPRVVDIGGQDYGLVAYLRLLGGSDGPDGEYTTASVKYHPKGSLGLATWDQPLMHATPPLDLPVPPPGYAWGAVRFTVPVSAQPKGMVRWQISPP